MDDLIAEFLTETNESLGAIDLDLVKLEQNPNDKELLSNIFRLMHTIKGTCGFLGLPRLEKVAHHAENIMGRFRDGDLEVTPDYVTLIFESLDRIKDIMSALEETGQEPSGDDSVLIEKLDRVYEGRDGDDNASAEESAPAEASAAETPGITEDEPDEHGFVPTRAPSHPGFAATNGAAPVEEAKTEEHTEDEPDEHGFVPTRAPSHPGFAATNGASAPKEATPAPAAQVAPAAAPQGNAAAPKTPVSAQSLRVSVDVLEDLMTMVSELVLTRNQLMQILRVQKNNEFEAPLQRLNHVVSELQEGVMKTRMQPIGNAWSMLPRIIRDLSMELGKKIDLQMDGQETELDRQVLDMIKDPLTHMVRNSADHGIEMPADRAAAGKPETGAINLNAFHEGGHIIIEIKDDGKGLNVEKIKEKILNNGLASPEELEAMSTQQINQFIFKAGFSTAEKVTAVSGRGVGMDVVRTNIEKIGGSVELNSVQGKGSVFSIKIPLTLAIVSALIVESAEEKFAIPQLAVRELVMISEKSENKVEFLNNSPVYRLRDQLLPLVSLDKLLKIQKSPSMLDTILSPDTDDSETAAVAKKPVDLKSRTDGDNKYIVVTQIGSYLFGIIVDRVFDTEEIVVKPVAKILQNVEMFSGNTILGDGTVIMILDPAGIAKASGEIKGIENREKSESDTEAALSDLTSTLLFAVNGDAPKAVPLSLVARLEEVNLSAIEYSDGRAVVQYRGELMPLMPFTKSMNLKGEGKKPVLVFSDRGRNMGLVVDEILDIVDIEMNTDLSSSGNTGLLGSAIIEGKATDIIDVGFYLNSTNKNWFANHGSEPYGEKANVDTKILLVDDSPFFRNMLTPLLKVAGYNVTTMESAVDALQLCENGAEFDMIISDIEMPQMDGFEFAKTLKRSETWQNTPMVALSSHATPQDISRGREVGFHKYVAKFDKDTLLDTISQTLVETGKAPQHSEVS